MTTVQHWIAMYDFLADHPPMPTTADIARAAAWSVFGEVSKAVTTATPSDRLRQYADACEAAAEAYHDVRVFGDEH